MIYNHIEIIRNAYLYRPINSLKISSTRVLVCTTSIVYFVCGVVFSNSRVAHCQAAVIQFFSQSSASILWIDFEKFRRSLSTTPIIIIWPKITPNTSVTISFKKINFRFFEIHQNLVWFLVLNTKNVNNISHRFYQLKSKLLMKSYVLKNWIEPLLSV